MRVISGLRRGTVLFSPETEGTRPTTDRVKENIFNIIRPYIKDAVSLDLFSGSGALGIEAISEGAESCVFVDESSSAINVINKNIKKCSFEKCSRVIKSDYKSALFSFGKPFDLIFLDPPYHKGLIDKALKTVLDKRLIEKDGIMVFECDEDETVPLTGEFEIIKEKTYGRIKITVARYTI